MSLADLIRRPVGAMAGYNPGPAPEELAATLGLPAMVELGTNENPFGPSPRALLAIQAELGRANRYPDPLCQPLREALARRHGLVPDNVVVANGADNLLTLLALAFLEPGQEVVMADLTFPMYRKMVALAGAVPREVPLYQLTHDLAALAAAVTPRTRLLLVCNPNNPTGTMVEPGALLDFAQALPPQVILVLDEAYVDFGGNSVVSLIPRYPNLVVVRTLSKSGALAGLRAGYAMGSPNLMDALRCVRDSINSYTVDRLAMAGAVASLQDKEWFEETTKAIIRTRQETARSLKKLGFTVYDSSSNFLFISHPKKPAKELLGRLRERGILVRWFDKPRISNCLRVSVGTDEEMEALCGTLSEILNEQEL